MLNILNKAESQHAHSCSHQHATVPGKSRGHHFQEECLADGNVFFLPEAAGCLLPSQIPGNWKTTYKCHPPTKQQNLTFVGRSRKDFLTFLIHHSWYMEEVGIRPTIIRRFKSIIIDDDKLIPTCLQISVNKEHWFL